MSNLETAALELITWKRRHDAVEVSDKDLRTLLIAFRGLTFVLNKAQFSEYSEAELLEQLRNRTPKGANF